MSGLLEPQLLKQLEEFHLLAARKARSSLRGERRSRARGQSVEFADYRNYVPGDDFRYLDWNLYGRLDRLFLKLYEEERELPVRIFLDASQSMTFGDPRKFEFARQVAAAIGYVALAGFDRLSVTVFPDRPRHGVPDPIASPQSVARRATSISDAEAAARRALLAIRGKNSAVSFFRDLSNLTAADCGNLNESLRRWALIGSRRGGLAVVLSDFLDPEGYEAGLGSLVSRGFQVDVVQILAPEEVNPVAFGDLRLVDSETGAIQEVTFSRFRRKAYQQTVQGFLRRLQEFCTARGINLSTVTSDTNLHELLLKKLRAAELWG